MSKTNVEITWSLMHPTPLDAAYMAKVVKHAKDARVDSFEICAQCHSNLGGLDGITDYAAYPTVHDSIDLEGIIQNRATLKQILSLAHSIGKPVYYWHREAMVPEGLLEELPDLLDMNGEFDLLGPAYEKLLRYKISSAFEAIPELDGLVLTLTEATYSVIHNSNQEKYPPPVVVTHIAKIFASELQSRGKRFILRSFGSIAKDYEDILAGAAEAAKEYHFEIETKITPYDFDPFLPLNPFLRKLPGATLGAECDSLGEFLGAGLFPAENVENIVKYVRNGQAAGVDRYAIRLDRNFNNVFDTYAVNLYAYTRAITDPSATAEDIRREYLESHAPASARETFAKIDKMGFDVIAKSLYINKNLIFHASPGLKIFNTLKAGFIFALFKNEVSLRNGREIWSIFSDTNTPGRDAILQEKEEAVAIADAALAELMKLPVEAGFENEYAWRKTLWENAALATRSLLALCRTACAYFDDMENGDEKGTQINAAAEAGCASIAGLKGNSEAVQKRFVEAFVFLMRQLVSDFKIDFKMRQKYAAGSTDCILCGTITDEWRILRYMHGAGAGENNSELFRFAGNTVFPNGFLEMEIAAPAEGGSLVINGDTTETADFLITVDDGVRTAAAFDADGKAEFAVAPGKDKIKIKLEKAPGRYYPRFRAVATFGK